MIKKIMRKKILTMSTLGLIALMLVLAGNIGVKMVNAQSSETLDDVYYFGTWQPGHTYHVQYSRFKRYGPQKEVIESNTKALFGPEYSVTDVSIEVDENGLPSSSLQTVKSNTGDVYYTFSRPNLNNPFRIIDYKSNTEFEIQPSSQKSTIGYTSPKDNPESFAESGWTLTGLGNHNGCETKVYNRTCPLSVIQIAPVEGQMYAPIYYDLNPVSFYYEMQIEPVTGVTLAFSRFAVDSMGNETLIENWSLNTLHEEQK